MDRYAKQELHADERLAKTYMKKARLRNRAMDWRWYANFDQRAAGPIPSYSHESKMLVASWW